MVSVALRFKGFGFEDAGASSRRRNVDSGAGGSLADTGLGSGTNRGGFDSIISSSASSFSLLNVMSTSNGVPELDLRKGDEMKREFREAFPLKRREVEEVKVKLLMGALGCGGGWKNAFPVF